VFVVGCIATVDLGGSVASEKCSEGLIDEGGIRDSRPRTPGTAEEFRIHRRTEPYAVNAIIMPLGPVFPLRPVRWQTSSLRQNIAAEPTLGWQYMYSTSRST
jgi:hypothetical protein